MTFGASLRTACPVGWTVFEAASDASRLSSAIVCSALTSAVRRAGRYCAPLSDSVGKLLFVTTRSLSSTVRVTRSTSVRAVPHTTPKVSSFWPVGRSATATRHASALPVQESICGW